MTIYRAFGLILGSDFHIPQLPPVEGDLVLDVELRRAPLPLWPDLPPETFGHEGEAVTLWVEGTGRFRMSGGRLIEADPEENCPDGRLSLYLMGSCMGTILHQRGLLPLHGSCVARGEQAVLITGASGAGKSTLAAEFLARGWELMTDDVAVLLDPAGTPTIQSSYPSQKLWEDSLSHYQRSPEEVHSLYQREEREKFGVSVARQFREGTCPLALVVRLVADELPNLIQPVEGFVKVAQLMENTYRAYLIAPKDRPRHFQACVDLAGRVPMALVVRNAGEQSAQRLYEMIETYLEEHP